MATNGSKSVAVTAYDTLKFNWVQVGQNTGNNTTVISWSLQLIAGSAGKIVSSVPKQWGVTVNGQTYSGTTSVALANNTTKTLASGQTTIAHNADGSKSFSYSFYQEFNIVFAGVNIGTVSSNGTGVLNTIPRATTPGLSTTSAEMGETIVLYTAGASDAFTHDLAYSFAGGGYVSIASGVVDSVYWKVPLTLANSIPSLTSGTVTIRCITKNGSTTVGTKTVLLTAKVPASATPTVQSVTLAEAVSTVADTIGAFVQNKSKVKVSIVASGVYGSTIKSITSTLEGKVYTGAGWTSDEIAGSGEVSIVTTVTDSRGRTASTTTPLTVLPYEAPEISEFSVARYNADGEADPDGVYARVSYTYGVTALNNKNVASAKLQYKKSTDTAWSTLDTFTSYVLSGTETPDTTFSTDYQWDFKLTLTDAFNSASPATYTAVLPSGAVILDIRADGKGLAFFKTSTKAGVDIDGALPGSAVVLTTNADLNSLTTPGFYVIPTATVSGTVSNKPYTDTAPASIRVEQTGTGMIRQIVQKATKTDGVIFERGRDSSGWGAWSIVYSGAGKILWTGSSLLTAGQTVTFSEPMSQQQSGVVLIFSRYTSGSARDYYYSCHFIPKQLVAAATAAGQTAAGVAATMATSQFDYIAGKFLRVTETGVTGDETNDASGTTNGITYNNGGFALRYVIGV